MSFLTLVIGGSYHSKLVSWPLEKRYWQIPVVEDKSSVVSIDEAVNKSPTRSEVYVVVRIPILNRMVDIWVYEKIEVHLNAKGYDDFIKLLLPEILSYKGARILEASGYRF